MSGTPPRIVRQETKNKITTSKTLHNAVFFYFYRGRANIAPRYAINKIKKISLGRFFKIFLIVYSRIRHACLWAMPTKTAFSYGAYAPMSALWRIRLGQLFQNKKTTEMVVILFWQGQLCNLRIDTMCELLQFGKDVKTFLQIL